MKSLWSRKETYLFAAIALIISIVYFGPFLSNFFTFDDFGLLENFNRGTSKVLLGYNFIPRFVANGVWLPLHYFSGFDPFGYNLFSLTFWFLNALLFYLLIDELIGERYTAFAAGSIFVANAVGSDAAFWRAASSSTLLCFTFYILTLLSYVKFRRSGKQSQWWLSVLFFVFAILSKEEAASLPFVILMLELLFFDGLKDKKGAVGRILVYCAIIAAYVAMNYILIYKVLNAQAEVARYSQFRPIRTLLYGWTAFFLTPESKAALKDIRIYAACLPALIALFYVKDRRLLIFAFGWVFFTFLPQSLSTLTQLEPRYICNSLSRHLYLPSAGVAIVYAALFARLRERVSTRSAVAVGLLFYVLFCSNKYTQIKSRGEAWREEGEPMRIFLTAIKKEIPEFPPNTFLYINNQPAGRAFVQQGLRAFYHTSSITWITDPNSYRPKPGENALFINCLWMPDGALQFGFYPWK